MKKNCVHKKDWLLQDQSFSIVKIFRKYSHKEVYFLQFILATGKENSHERNVCGFTCSYWT